MINAVDVEVKKILDERLSEINKLLDSDVLVYFGPIDEGIADYVKENIEKIAADNKFDKLTILLTTYGGSASAAERYVNIFRHHYKVVDFMIPDFAYSAGTILCLSGDNILMNYFSVLGPIDPQVRNKEGHWVAALGYLDKINDLIIKAQKGTLTDAEFIILKDFDLAELRSYEQAKELTIDLLKQWLVKYKFKNWNKTETRGVNVTTKMKNARAKDIANKLSDNNKWKSHGRPINIETIRSELRLIIEDYGENKDLYEVVDSYFSLLKDYILKGKNQLCIHSSCNFLLI